MIKQILRTELKDVLMDPKSPGVKDPYYIIEGENNQNVIILSPGKNGNEFNKTIGYFSHYPAVETYHIVYGQGVLVTQRNDQMGDPKEVRIVGVRNGNTVEVPVGYGHCLVNVGKNFLIAVCSQATPAKYQNTEPLKQRKGLAYYLVDKKGDIAFEQNPNYTMHPQLTTG